MDTTSTDLFRRLHLDRFCLASRSNTHDPDPYAVAVVDRGATVGHVRANWHVSV